MEDAKEVIKQGVDYLGFVIDFPKSPRSVSAEDFLNIAGRIKQECGNLPETIPKIVAVTVNMSEEKLEELLKAGVVDVFQFHGNESPELCEKYKDKIEVWKAFKPELHNKQEFLQEIEKYKDKVHRFLIDASSAADKGEGQNEKFQNFELFELLRSKNYPLILAGGLDPENVRDYVEKLKPDTIDTASGIEEFPGKKSKKKMKEFISNIK